MENHHFLRENPLFFFSVQPAIDCAPNLNRYDIKDRVIWKRRMEWHEETNFQAVKQTTRMPCLSCQHAPSGWYWKIHYKWPFSIAMLVHERVSSMNSLVSSWHVLSLLGPSRPSLYMKASPRPKLQSISSHTGI